MKQESKCMNLHRCCGICCDIPPEESPETQIFNHTGADIGFQDEELRTLVFGTLAINETVRNK